MQLTCYEWKRQSVVTRQQVADVHGISVKTVESAHDRNAKHFKRGTDYFRLASSDLRTFLQDAGECDPRTPSLHLYTERGYLKLAKPLTDDTVWEVKDRLLGRRLPLGADQGPRAKVGIP